MIAGTPNRASASVTIPHLHLIGMISALALVNQPYTYSVEALDPDGDPLTFSFAAAPFLQDPAAIAPPVDPTVPTFTIVILKWRRPVEGDVRSNSSPLVTTISIRLENRR